MNERLKTLIQADRQDRARHEEMLDSVAVMHGDKAATALLALHKQYRVVAADMMQLASHLPESLRERYIDAHQHIYNDVVAVVLDLLIPDGAKKQQAIEELATLLARMNHDTALLLIKATGGEEA